jgi:RNA polymerase sigma-70 factor (ECF subfamily)
MARMALRLVKTADPVSDEGLLDPKTLFASYASFVAAIAARLLGRSDEVADVVQDVFAVVVAGIDKLKAPEAAKGWLATITVRVAMRRIRRRRLRSWLSLDPACDYLSLPDPSLSGEERAAVAAIYRLLDRFPVKQRTAWLLHHGESLPAAEVAEICGCSLATAKRWIADGNEKIRRAITHG